MSISLSLKLYLPFLCGDDCSSFLKLAGLLGCGRLHEAFLSLSESVSLLEEHLTAVNRVLEAALVDDCDLVGVEVVDRVHVVSVCCRLLVIASFVMLDWSGNILVFDFGLTVTFNKL